MRTVAVTLTNERAWLTEYDEGMYEVLQDHWSFYPQGYRWAPSHKLWLWKKIEADKKKARTGQEYDINSLPGWNGKLKILKNGSLPAGFFRAVYRDTQQELKIRFVITYDLPKLQEFLPGLPKSEDKKYAYQDECVAKMCGALRRGGGIVLSATGTGKTALTAKFFSKLPYSCLFVVDQIDLLYQTQEEMAMWLGEPVGVVGDQEFTLHRVTVATRQTLGKHLKDKKYSGWFKSIQVQVVDELHEQMGRTSFEILEKVQPIARYGLTATLQLTKKHIRAKAWMFAGPVIFEFPLSEGVESGVLSKGIAIQLRFPERIMGDEVYHYAYRDEVVNNEDKHEALRRIAQYMVTAGRHTIALVEHVKHVEALSNACEGIPHTLAYGAVGQKIRLRDRGRFEKGRISLIIANKVFKKGINIKIVDVMIDLAEMKSPNDTQQKFGRGVRLHPDKDQLVYIDIGTEGNGRFGKRARSRVRSLRKLGVKVKVVNVETPRGALKAVVKFMGALCRNTKEKQPERQLTLLQGN